MRDVVVERFGWLAAIFVVVWGVQILNAAFGYALNGWFGLIPRRLSGLDGIVLMPFLHGSFSHAAANTPPLLAFGTVLALTAQRVALAATGIIVCMGGAAVWLLGKPAIHVGASGLIFGWFGFLLARGLVERRPIPLMVSLGLAIAYGAMIWGVLPGQPGVSWESHLLGAVAGVGAAFLLRRRHPDGPR